MTKPACSNCIFWRQSKNLGPDYGYCHKLPPRAARGDGSSMWPAAMADDWCGEHFTEYRAVSKARQKVVKLEKSKTRKA